MAEAEEIESPGFSLTDVPVWNGFIRLEDIYPLFGFDLRRAKKDAAARKLPVPAFRVTESQKSGWMIAEKDVTKYLLKRADGARKDFDRFGSAE